MDLPRAHAVADFHATLPDECGNVALGMVGRALHDVVLRIHELIDLIERGWCGCKGALDPPYESGR